MAQSTISLPEALPEQHYLLTAADSGLQGREFLAGEFSGADIMTGHACVVATRLGADVSDKPNVAAYVERLQARPALQRAWDA